MGPATCDVTRGDRPLVAALVLLLALAAALSPIRSFDYWWHLKTGSWILENRAVPHEDPFSFTAEGTAWVDHEWLFQIAAHLAHLTIGPEGLVLLKVVLVLLLCLLMLSHLRRQGHGPLGTALLLVPTFLGASFRLDVRPELATLALLPLLVHLLLLARDRDTRVPLLIVPPMVVVWANLHAGVILAPVVLAIGACASALFYRLGGAAAAGGEERGRRNRFLVRMAWLTAVVGACVAVNPYGFRIYAVPFELDDLLRSLPWPNLEWAPPQVSDFPLFWMVAPLSLIAALAAARRIDPIATPAMLLTAVLGALHLRNLGIFFVLLPYGLGRPLRALAETLRRRRLPASAARGGRVRPAFIAATTILVVAFGILVVLPPGVVFGIGIASANEPRAAVDFLQREGVGERLFNDVRFGGYLIWRRYPAHRVFIDGRNEIYPDLLRDIAAAMTRYEPWEELMGRHRIDSAFLRYPPALQKVLYTSDDGGEAVVGERAFSAAYFPREKWALVYWDDDAMIFLRRLAKYEHVIERLEYRAIHPDDWRHILAGAARGMTPVGPIVQELDRKLKDEPGCLRAQELRARFAVLDEKLSGAPSGEESEER